VKSLSESILFAAVLALAGCATGTTANWRAGASGVEAGKARPMPRGSAGLAVHFKEAFGALEGTESRRHFACATVTVLRKSFLLSDEPQTGPEDRSYEVLAHVTTEEFPRDEERSKIHKADFGSAFGIGDEPHDLFDVALDPAFRAEAVERLRYYAAQLGADAVIEVYATGEAEYQMWEGGKLGFDRVEPSSPIYVGGRLLSFILRDVRLHGTAIRYE